MYLAAISLADGLVKLVCTGAVVLSLTRWLRERRRLDLHLLVQFAVMLLIEIYVYAQETDPPLAAFLDLPVVPSLVLKSICYDAVVLLMTWALFEAGGQKVPAVWAVPALLVCVWTLCVPLTFGATVLTSYSIYLLPYEAYTLALSLRGFRLAGRDGPLRSPVLRAAPALTVLIILEDVFYAWSAGFTTSYGFYMASGLYLKERNYFETLLFFLLACAWVRDSIRVLSAAPAVPAPAEPPPPVPEEQPRPERYGDFAEAIGLTARERDVLLLLLDGETVQEIGDRLYISWNTVNTHIRNICQKAGVTRRAELAEKAAAFRPAPPGQEERDG